MDDWNITANRAKVYSDGDFVNAERDSENITAYRTMNRAYVGDVVSFQCTRVHQQYENFSSLFGYRVESGDYTDTNVIGRITAISIASRGRASNNFDLNGRSNNCTEDMLLIRKLSSMLCDGNHIVTSGNNSNNRRRQLFGAGDSLAILRSIYCDDADICIVLVNRFNVPSGEGSMMSKCFVLHGNPIEHKTVIFLIIQWMMRP